VIPRTKQHEKTGISIWTAERDPTFPKPVQLSTQRLGYFEDELDAWLANRPRAARKPKKKKSEIHE
jgi:predicted DNA-binding transcriptional regulator AlpA